MVRIGLNEEDKARCQLWKQQMREEKKQKEEQSQQEKEANKKKKEEEKHQMKKDKREFVGNFILNFYEITSNINDKVQSSILGKKINEAFNSFVDSKTIKDVLINIQGISLKRFKECNHFCGLKQK